MWWLKGDQSEDGENGSSESGVGAESMPMDANTVSEMKEKFDQQQELIHQLKELVRGNELQLRQKEIDLQESAAKLSKLKLQHKAKLQEVKIRGSNSSTTSTTAEDESVPEISTATDSSRGKVLMLKRQMEESRVIFEKREKALKDNKRSIEEVLENLKIELKERDEHILALKLSQKTEIDEEQYDNQFKESVKSPETKEERGLQEMYAQIVYKDSRILELNDRILELEANVMDLQENLKEKDEVILSRNKAIQLMTEDLSRRGKVVVDQLDDTRDEMRLMQHNFSTVENEWQMEKEKLLEDLDAIRNRLESETTKKSSQIAELQNTISKMETARFDLSARNAALQEKVILLRDELKKSKDKFNKTPDPNQDFHSEVIEQMSKIKELEEKIIELETVQCTNTDTDRFQNKIVDLEEEKGNLQLKLVDYEELFSKQAMNDAFVNELKEKLQQQSDELDNHVKMVSMLQTEKMNLVQMIQSQEEHRKQMTNDYQSLEQAKISLEMRLVEVEELKDAADVENCELTKQIGSLTERLENNERPVLDVENKNDDLQKKTGEMQHELDHLQNIIQKYELSIDELNSKLLDAENELHETKGQLNRSQENESTLQNDLLELQTEHQTLQEKLDAERLERLHLEANWDDAKISYQQELAFKEDTINENTKMITELIRNHEEIKTNMKIAYDGEIRSLKQETEHLKELLQEKDLTIKELHTEIVLVNDSNKETDSIINEKEKEITDLRHEMQFLSEHKNSSDKKLEDKVASLIDQLSEMESEVCSLQEQLNDEKVRGKNLLTERDIAVEGEIQAALGELENLHRLAMTSCEKMISQMREELQAKTQELDLTDSDCKLLKEQTNILKKSLHEFEANVAEKESRLEEMLVQYNEKENQLKDTLTKLLATENRITDLTAELENTRLQIEEFKQQTEQWQSEYHKSNEIASEVNKSFDQTSIENQELIAILENQKLETKKTTRALTLKIEELTSENTKHLTQISSLHQALQAVESSRIEYEKLMEVGHTEQQLEIDSLKEILNKLSSSSTTQDELQKDTDMSKSNHNNDDKEVQTSHLSDDYERKQQDFEERIEELNNEKQRLNLHVNQLETQVEKLQKLLEEEKANLETEKNELENKCLDLQTEKNELENKCLDLVTEKNELENNCLDLKNTKDQLQIALNKTNSSSEEIEQLREANIKLISDNQRLENDFAVATNKADSYLEARDSESNKLIEDMENILRDKNNSEIQLNNEKERSNMLDLKLLEEQQRFTALECKREELEREFNQVKLESESLIQLHNKNQELNVRIENEAQEKSGLCEQVQKLEEELEISRSMYFGLESSLSELNIEKLDQDRKIIKLSDEINLLNAGALESQISISNLNESIEKTVHELSEKDTKIMEQNGKLTEAEVILQDTVDQLIASTSEIENLRLKFQDSEALYQQLQTKLEKHFSTMAFDKNHSDDLCKWESDVIHMTNELNGMQFLKESYETALEKVSELEAKLENLNLNRECISCQTEKEKDEEQTNELDDMRLAIDTAQKQVLEFQQLLFVSESKLTVSEATNHKLQEQLKSQQENTDMITCIEHELQKSKENNQQLQEEILKMASSQRKMEEGLQCSVTPTTKQDIESVDSQQQIRNQLAVFKIKNEKMLVKLKQFKDKNDKMHLQINDLMSTQVSLEDTIVRLREMNERASEEIRHRTFDLRNLETLWKSEVQTLTDRLDMLEVANGNLIEIKDDLENRLTTKQQQFQSEKVLIEDNINLLKRQIKDHEDKFKLLLEENDHLKIKLENSEIANHELLEIKANNEVDKAKYEHEIKAQIDNYMLLVQENHRLQEQVGHNMDVRIIQDKYDILMNEFTELQKYKLQLEAKEESLNTQLDMASSQNALLEVEVSKLTESFNERQLQDNYTSKEALSNLELENQQLKDNIDHIQDEILQTRNTGDLVIQKLQTELNDERMQSKNFHQKLSHFETLVCRLQEEATQNLAFIANKETSIELMAKEREELLQKLSDQENRIDTMEKENKKKEEEYFQLIQKQKFQESLPDTNVEDVIQLQNELYIVRDELGKGMLHLKEEMEKVSFLESHNEQLKADVENLTNSLDRNENQMESYRVKIQNLQDENEAMELQLSNWKKHLGSVVNETQIINETEHHEPELINKVGNDQLNQDMERLNSRAESLDAELQHCMQSLHLRDLRCEEFSSEITRMIDERDSLQVRLSSLIRSDQEKEMRIELMRQEQKAINKQFEESVAIKTNNLPQTFETGNDLNQLDYETLCNRLQSLDQKHTEVLQLNAVLEQALFTERETRLKSMAELKMANEELCDLGIRKPSFNNETRISLSDDTVPLVPEHSQTLIRSYSGAAWRIANWIQGRRRHLRGTLRNGPSARLLFYAYIIMVHFMLLFKLF